jgi:hypothetical protein
MGVCVGSSCSYILASVRARYPDCMHVCDSLLGLLFMMFFRLRLGLNRAC